MTLCIAWRFKTAGSDKVCFAADSCYGIAGRLMSFGGVKVLQIPVEYGTPTDALTGNAESPWKTTYGLAFCGDVPPAFILKELLSNVFTHLQGIGGASHATFEKICGIVAKLHTHFFCQIRDSIDFQCEVEFFFGGYCPLAKRVKVAHFSLLNGRSQWEEILTAEGVSYKAIGCARAVSRFNELIELNLGASDCRIHYVALRRLREIILDNEFPNVAGAIQYGDFDSRGAFELVGSGMMELEDGRPKMVCYIMGTDVEKIHQGEGLDDLIISYPYLAPFHEDIVAFDSKSFWGPDGERISMDEITTIVPFNEKWKDSFYEEEALLRIYFRDAIGIEHIGSTVIPGMPSVPVIDIMIGLNSIWEERAPPVKLRDYEYVGNDSIDLRRLYRKRSGIAYFNVNVVVHDGGFWKAALRLREFLKSDLTQAREYGREKVRILNSGTWTSRRYNLIKQGVVQRIAASAGIPVI